MGTSVGHGALVAIAVALAAGCGERGGTLLTFVLPEAPALGDRVAFELFLAELPDDGAVGALTRDYTPELDLGTIDAAALAAGFDVLLTSPRAQRLQVAVIAFAGERGTLPQDGAPLYFASTQVNVGPDVARTYAPLTLTVQPRGGDRAMWPDCRDADDAGDAGVEVWGDPDAALGRCVRWRLPGELEVAAFRHGADRDCDGTTPGFDEKFCPDDARQCDPGTLEEGQVAPADDVDGDGRTAAFVLATCTPCVGTIVVDGVVEDGPVPCDCDETRGDRFFGAADDACDGVDADCDGLNDAGEPVTAADLVEFANPDADAEAELPPTSGDLGGLGYDLATCARCTDGAGNVVRCDCAINDVTYGPETGYLVPEACDGVDNDCDGLADATEARPGSLCVAPGDGAACAVGAWGCAEAAGVADDACLPSAVRGAIECVSTTWCDADGACATVAGTPRTCTQRIDDVGTTCGGIAQPLAPLWPTLGTVGAGPCDAALIGADQDGWKLGLTGRDATSNAEVAAATSITGVRCDSLRLVNSPSTIADDIDVLLLVDWGAVRPRVLPLRLETTTGACNGGLGPDLLQCPTAAFDTP